MNRWPKNNACFWEAVPFFRILLPFAAGILCYYKGWFSDVPGHYFLWAGAISWSLLAMVLFAQKTNRAGAAITFALVTVILFAGGLSTAFYNDIRNSKTWFGRNISPAKTYLARITAPPAAKENSWKLPVAIIGSIDATGVSPASGLAIVYRKKDNETMHLHRGDTILLPGMWEPVTDAGNPFEFSYAGYCARNNILHRQWCRANDIQLYAACNLAASPLTERVHDWCMMQLSNYLGSHKAMGLLQAMLLGEEVNLDQDLRQSYSETGIVHIIAISGGNVAIFFLIISFLLGWVKHKRYLWVKYAIALPVIWFYVLMAGAQPSAIRAAAMFSLLAFGIMMQKNNNGINQLLATAFVLLCAEPAWLFSVGFQLSFVAVLSILLFYTPVYNWVPVSTRKASGGGILRNQLQWVYGIPRLLWSAVAMSIAAEILVAPLVVYYFHTFPVMFIVANVAAFLFMGFVLVLGMILVVLSNVPVLAGFIAAIITWLVDLFGKIVAYLQGVGPRSFGYLVLTGYGTVLLYIIIAGVAWYLLRQYKPALFGVLSVACLLLLSSCVVEWYTLQQRKLVIYNTARVNHIELIVGRRYSVLHTGSMPDKKIRYATRPAHTGWGAWMQQLKDNGDIFCIGDKTALVLNRKMSAAERFPVDYLILNCTGPINVHELTQVFSPSVIVVGNNFSRKQQAAIIADCEKEGVSLHDVADKGAFVLAN